MSNIDSILKHLVSEHTHGYGPLPIPTLIDAEVDEIITLLTSMDANSRCKILSTMTETHGYVLIAFAERMASYAVREKQLGPIIKGFSALAIATNLVYIKEALPIVCLLCHSISKLGMDARSTFSENCCYKTKVLDEFVNEYLDRSDENRSIKAMGYVEDQDQDGFRYRRTW